MGWKSARSEAPSMTYWLINIPFVGQSHGDSRG